MTWYWLSFVSTKDDKEQFVGGCLIEAETGGDAYRTMVSAGLNPGGEVSIAEVPGEPPEGFPRNQLLSRADIDKHGGGRSRAEMSEEEKAALNSEAVCEDCNPKSS